MKNLVCCDFGFRCSPYQPNNVPVRQPTYLSNASLQHRDRDTCIDYPFIALQARGVTSTLLVFVLPQGGCPYQQACPSLGAADPESRYHSKAAQDLHYPQADEAIRKSSSVRAL